MNILTCTKDNPYTEARDKDGARWEHDNVHEVGEQEDDWLCGDTVWMECRNCGVQWEVELAQ